MKTGWINKIWLYGNVLIPSGLSVVVAAAVAAVTYFAYHLHIFLTHFEVNGSLRPSNFVSGRVRNLLSSVFGTHAANSAVLIMFWAAVGLIVYIIGQIIAKDISEFSTDVNQRNKYLWPSNSKPKALERFFESFLFSIAVLIVLIIYCGRVLGFFLRGKTLALPIFGPGAKSWLQAHSVVNDIVFILAEIVALQVVVILLRLLFKRSRLVT